MACWVTSRDELGPSTQVRFEDRTGGPPATEKSPALRRKLRKWMGFVWQSGAESAGTDGTAVAASDAPYESPCIALGEFEEEGSACDRFKDMR